MSADQASTDGQRAAVTLPSDPAELERVIEERRTHLAATVEELTARVHPREIARRSAGGVRGHLVAATRTDDGQWRIERIGAVVAVAVVAVAALVWTRRRRAR